MSGAVLRLRICLPNEFKKGRQKYGESYYGVSFASRMMIRLSLIIGLMVAALNLYGQSRATHEALRSGDRAMDRTQFEKAGQYYKKAQQLAPKNGTSGYNLGTAQYSQGDYEAAGQTFSSMLNNAETPQQRADAYHNLGNSLYHQKKYDAAVKAYQQSLRNRPGDAGTQQNLAMALKKRQEQQAQQQQPQSPPPTPPPPSSEQQQGDSEQQPYPSETPRDESDEQMLQYIDEEDKKNRRKYQDKSASKAANRKQKDW
jgi:Ca-activated chloride channel homolog